MLKIYWNITIHNCYSIIIERTVLLRDTFYFNLLLNII